MRSIIFRTYQQLFRYAMACFLPIFLLFTEAVAQTSFTYQGFLRESGLPANGTFDFRFRMFTDPTGGTQVDSDQLVNDHSVQNGLFTVSLNFGSAWNGDDRYLEISVRPGSSTGSYQVLTPRVKVTPTPYAMYALKPWEPNAGAIYYNDGNVGIGTNNPAARLSLGGGNADTKLALWQGSAAGEIMGLGVGTGQFRLHLHTPGNRFSFLNAPDGSELVTIKGDGNVGIGTNSPSERLHIVGGNLRVDNGAIQSWGPITLHPDVDISGDDVVRFVNSAGNETMRIHSDGKVGIGTSSPSQQLHVVTTTAQRAIYGHHPATTGENIGVWGESASTSGRGVYGWVSAPTGVTYGVLGRSDSTSGRAVAGWASANSGTTTGVWGESASTDARGVYGYATATTGITIGVYGRSESPSGRGVVGWVPATSGNTTGVWGESASTSGRGVIGWATARTGETYGVYGQSDSPSGFGVVGNASAYGVYGQSASTSGFGVYSQGRFAASGTKSFQIDHPLMPETHYLNHFCTEGPEPYNIYRGTVMLDARGEAWVQLSDYFHAINRDPSYHLTAIGAPMPNLHVAVKIQNNRFKIAGGVPGKEVSWEVKAIRNDRWVQQYGFQTEQPKPDAHKGKYLHPELYGQPKEKGIFYHPEPERPTEPTRKETSPN